MKKGKPLRITLEGFGDEPNPIPKRAKADRRGKCEELAMLEDVEAYKARKKAIKKRKQEIARRRRLAALHRI